MRDLGSGSDKSNQNIHKRNRRCKDEILRDFKCTIKGCDKAYGSENALYMHVKVKHATTHQKKRKPKLDSTGVSFTANMIDSTKSDKEIFFDDFGKSEELYAED